MFNVSAWLAEIIPDHSTIGAYSNSLQARLYKQTGQSVPNILMLAAFGGPEIANTMRHFMRLLEMAERELSKEHFAVQDSVHPKDKGPFLYWLANKASDDQRHVLGTVLADLRQVDYSEISERLQGRPTKRHLEYRDDRARQAVADSCPSAQETAATSACEVVKFGELEEAH